MYYGFKKELTFFSYLQMVTNKFSPKTLSFGTAKQQRNSLMGFFVFQVSCWGGGGRSKFNYIWIFILQQSSSQIQLNRYNKSY